MLKRSSAVFQRASLASVTGSIEKLTAVVTSLKSDTDALKSDTTAAFAALKSDTDASFAALKSDTDASFAALKSDTTSLKSDCKSLGTKIDGFDRFLKASEVYNRLFYVAGGIFMFGTVVFQRALVSQAQINGRLEGTASNSGLMLSGLMSGDVVNERIKANQARVIVTDGTVTLRVAPQHPDVMALKDAIKEKLAVACAHIDADRIIIIHPETKKKMGDEDELYANLKYIFEIPN